MPATDKSTSIIAVSPATKTLASPDHQAVKAWLDSVAQRLNLDALEQLTASLALDVAAAIKRYKDLRRAIRLRDFGYRQNVAQCAKTHQFLQVAKPALRWARVYRVQLKRGCTVRKPNALGELLLSKALREAPQALWKPLDDRESWNLRYTADATTPHEQQVARQIIEANASLFGPLPVLKSRLPNESTLRTEAARKERISARMAIVNKVRKAGILTDAELQTLFSMV